MTDESFIKQTIQKGVQAKDKVRLEFSNISLEQLNWKPSPESWSIAQCLEHLIISHNSYFSSLEKITEGNYKMSSWEKYSPFTRLCGRLLIDQLKEQVKTKRKAPKKIQPTSGKANLDIIEVYQKNLERFLTLISNCRSIDLDKTIITSPTISIVTYNLRDAFQFLLQHEHRHINQAIRVKQNENFPGKEFA